MNIVKDAHMEFFKSSLKLLFIHFINRGRNGLGRENDLVFGSEMQWKLMASKAIKNRSRFSLMACTNNKISFFVFIDNSHHLFNLLAIGAEFNISKERCFPYTLRGKAIFNQAS